MLNKDTAEKLGKILPKGITLEILSKAITSDKEETIDLPEGRFLTTDNESKLLDNHGKTKYNEGKTAGSEITIKELKEKTGLEFEGKDADKFVSEFKTSILKDAKIEPEKKVKELQSSLEKLQNQYKTDLSTKDSELQRLQGSLQQQKTISQLSTIIPELSSGVSKQDAITLFNAQFEIKEDGIYKGGELLKDNLQNPMTLEQSVNDFLSEKGWNAQTPTGRGNDFQGGKGGDALPTNQKEYESYIESKGYNPAGQDAKALRMKMLESNPEAFE